MQADKAHAIDARRGGAVADDGGGLPANRRKVAYTWFDALRCVAAVTVVLGHVRDLVFVDAAQVAAMPAWGKPFYFITGFGHEAVIVFFVLSGFWITGSVEARRARGGPFWRGYLVDRLSRLGIVALPALVVGGLLDAAGLWWLGAPVYAGNGAHSLPADIGAQLSVTTFLGNVAFLEDLAVPAFGSNAPLWSLALEFWFYMIFAALMMAWRRRRFAALAVLVVGLIWPKVFAGFLVWLVGSGLYYLDARQRAVSRRSWIMAASSVPALAGALIVSRLALMPQPVCDVFIALAFAVVLWAMLRGAAPRVTGLQLLANYGANASFSLYAIHYPVALFAIAVAGWNARLQPGSGALWRFALAVLVAVTAGWIFARLTEARTPRLRAALRAWTDPAASAAPRDAERG